jgi:hypothetical protein
MAARKRSSAVRAHDLELLSAAILKGRPQSEFAHEHGLSRQQVSYDKFQLERAWYEQACINTSLRRAIELAKIDHMECTAWEGWQRSLRDAESSSSERTSDTDGGKERVSLQREARDGDTKWLSVVQWCIEQRCKIHNLYAQPKVREDLLDAMIEEQLQRNRELAIKAYAVQQRAREEAEAAEAAEEKETDDIVN